jgi:hypothetical protein
MEGAKPRKLMAKRIKAWAKYFVATTTMVAILIVTITTSSLSALASALWEKLRDDRCSLDIAEAASKNWTGPSGRVYKFVNFVRQDQKITLNFQYKTNTNANFQSDSYEFNFNASSDLFEANHSGNQAKLQVIYVSGSSGAFIGTTNSDPNKEWFDQITSGGIALVCQSGSSNPPSPPDPGTSTTYTAIAACRISTSTSTGLVKKEITNNGKVIKLGLTVGEAPTKYYDFDYIKNSDAPVINQPAKMLYKVQGTSNQVVMNGTTYDTYLRVPSVGNNTIDFVGGVSDFQPFSISNPTNDYERFIQNMNSIAVQLDCKTFDGEIAANKMQLIEGTATEAPRIILDGDPLMGRPKTKYKLQHVVLKGGLGAINENLYYFIFETALDNSGNPASPPGDIYNKLAIRVSPISGKIFAIYYGNITDYADDSDNSSTANPQTYGYSEITGFSKTELYGKIINWTYKEKNGSSGECAKTTGPQDASPKADQDKATWGESETPNDTCIMINGVEGVEGVPATPIGWLAKWQVKANKAGLLGPTTVDTSLCSAIDISSGGFGQKIGSAINYAICWMLSQMYYAADWLFTKAVGWLAASIGLQFSG